MKFLLTSLLLLLEERLRSFLSPRICVHGRVLIFPSGLLQNCKERFVNDMCLINLTISFIIVFHVRELHFRRYSLSLLVFLFGNLDLEMMYCSLNDFLIVCESFFKMKSNFLFFSYKNFMRDLELIL